MVIKGIASYFAGPYENLYDLDVIIGNYTSIAQTCRFIGVQHNSAVNRNAVSNFPFSQVAMNYPDNQRGKPVNIGHDVWIGANVTIMEGVTIESGAIIGAGCMVTKSVPAYAVVVGNPQTIKRFRFSTETIHKLLELAWWGWDEQVIRQRIADFNDTNTFIERYHG